LKSPIELAQKLTKQWHRADIRETRLFSPDAWPISLPIGKPSAEIFKHQPKQLREHLTHWNQVTQGQVIKQSVKYQSSDRPLDIPMYWQLNKPSDWIDACQDKQVTSEYALYQRLISATDSLFHPFLIRQKHLVINTVEASLIKACELSLLLEPGIAEGKPLRSLSIASIDTKFWETHYSLLIRLLELRFPNQIKNDGLECFLGAAISTDRWLLLVPLNDDILPFKQLRLRTSELANTALLASNIVIIENESCVHLLPDLPDTIAILGAGRDLKWMRNQWLGEKNLAYWGDMDTWGMAILAQARLNQSQLIPLMMSQELFEQLALQYAVLEPTACDENISCGLNLHENAFYQFLQTQKKGRIEQEFMPKEIVHEWLRTWHSGLV